MKSCGVSSGSLSKQQHFLLRRTAFSNYQQQHAIENVNEAVSRHWSSSHTNACNMKHSIMALVCVHKAAVLWVDLHLDVKHMHSCVLNSFRQKHAHGPSQFDCAHTLDSDLHRIHAPHAVPVA